MSFNVQKTPPFHIDFEDPFKGIRKDENSLKDIHEYFKNITEKKQFFSCLIAVISTLILFTIFGFVILSKHLLFSIILLSIVGVMAILCIIFCIFYRKNIKKSFEKRDGASLSLVIVYFVVLALFLFYSYDRMETFVENEN